MWLDRRSEGDEKDQSAERSNNLSVCRFRLEIWVPFAKRLPFGLLIETRAGGDETKLTLPGMLCPDD